jgi:hypothetical protein
MKRHTNAIFKKLKKQLLHIAETDCENCNCKLCFNQTNGTYVSGCRDAMLLIGSAILNDERMENLKNAK